jgi:hypothetical protein
LRQVKLRFLAARHFPAVPLAGAGETAAASGGRSRRRTGRRGRGSGANPLPPVPGRAALRFRQSPQAALGGLGFRFQSEQRLILEESGKEAALLPLPPLRTVLESFPSYGSSLYKSCISLQNRQFIELMLGVDLTMAVSVEQLQVVQRVTSPFCPVGDMVNHPFLV